jgi:hypothetical protein
MTDFQDGQCRVAYREVVAPRGQNNLNHISRSAHGITNMCQWDRRTSQISTAISCSCRAIGALFGAISDARI